MPVRNSRKQYTPDSYYHVYSRGVNRQAIFRDDQDYRVFLGYLKRYLSAKPGRKATRQVVRGYHDEIELLAYCLMSNHIHLLFYQHENERAVQEVMQRILTTYSMYFNRRYDRCGPLFQGRYLASRIDNDGYLLHISRYIHLNPKLWRDYKYSSLVYYLSKKHSDWVRPKRIMEIFHEQSTDYEKFLADYEPKRDELEQIKTNLANN
ncbi:transposase [Candidatus Saccharibacteria bacterium]|nr:MAG: transposase [Candidatus Saccharibacteria bacterium]